MDFILNHECVKGQSVQNLTQDEMRDQMKIYLQMIKHDANEYIDNPDINLGEIDYSYEADTQDIYADCVEDH